VVRDLITARAFGQALAKPRCFDFVLCIQIFRWDRAGALQIPARAGFLGGGRIGNAIAAPARTWTTCPCPKWLSLRTAETGFWAVGWRDTLGLPPWKDSVVLAWV